ncbi:MAG: IPT/TIG domain-containing protein [Acidobacteriales bacterium]|nr:IPT/TIG domain-containing protein [Terriglobales bacterium]
MFLRLFLSPRLLFLSMVMSVAMAMCPPAPLSAQTFNGVELSVDSQTIPPGGLLQYRVFVTEPKPILKGGQCLLIGAGGAPASPLGRVRDGMLFSPAGDVDGVAVLGQNVINVAFSSPLTSYGTDMDTPVMAFGIPVLSSATLGQSVPLTLNTATAQWFKPSGQVYPLKVNSGSLTVGGQTAISAITPGSGTVQPGTVIKITRVGFQSDSKVDINEGSIATTKFISPTEIQVTLATPLAIEGRRVRVDTGNERAEYYAYQQIRRVGTSAHALIASSYPMFSHTTWTQAYLKPTLQGSTFSALGLQNMDTNTATVNLQLFSSSGALLASRTITLATNTRIVRDYAEYFPGQIASTGTTVEVTSSVPVQVLGLLGDDSTFTLSPVQPSATMNAEPKQQHTSYVKVTC